MIFNNTILGAIIVIFCSKRTACEEQAMHWHAWDLEVWHDSCISIQEKLVNFMAATRYEEPPMASQLFRNLFGQRT